ncbi:MAG: NAD(P)-dependent oxidoreductase [Thermoproteota archaeon]
MKARLAIVNYPYLKGYRHIEDILEKLQRYYDVEFIDVGGAGEEELAGSLRGFHVLIVSHTPFYGRKFFSLNRDVRLLMRFGIGYDNVDVGAAEDEGVLVARIPNEVEREAVAEHTIALMLAALRRVTVSDYDMRRGKVSPGVYNEYVLEELTAPANLSEMVVGIVGLGHIGSRVAEILVRGFGARVIAYDPYIDPSRAGQLGVELVGSLEELVRQSDIVSIHAPLTSETRHMISRDVLKKAKRGLILVNTARGAIVDMDALLWALDKGVVSFAALDVFDPEPLPPNHPILARRNVVLSPHIAVFTHTTLRRMFESVALAAIAYARGEPLEQHVVVVVKPPKPRPRPFTGGAG